jgi:molybdenum cofactor guanylyltransferase
MAANFPFSALILAGGKSSRMGQDKALLTLNGQSLLEHMQQLAIAAGASEVLVSRNQPGFIQDSVAQQGPLAGILAALAHCKAPLLLVLPIDTPLLTVASLKQLLQRADGHTAYFANSPLPCLLAVNTALSSVIATQLQGGQRSVKALLTQLNGKTLTITATELLNTNTPEDWQRCLAQFAAAQPVNSVEQNNYAKI